MRKIYANYLESCEKLDEFYENRIREIEEDYQKCQSALVEKYQAAKIETLEKEVKNLKDLIKRLVEVANQE